jgi:hypothetical protein
MSINGPSSLEALTKTDIVEHLIHDLSEDTTSTDIKKAISILMKARLFTAVPRNSKDDSDDKLWKLENKQHFLQDVDLALLVRLLASPSDSNMEPSEHAISEPLYGKYTKPELRQLMSTAIALISTKAEQGTPADPNGARDSI